LAIDIAVAMDSRSESFLGPKAWRHGLKYPIYVPDELSQIRKLLSQGLMSGAAIELWRLATLGSDAAAALLDFICLQYNTLNDIDRTAVAARCREAAERGNCYAQYVVSARAYHEQHFPEAWSWINRSSAQGFLPAIGDLGVLAATGLGMSKKYPDLAWRALWDASRKRHLISIMSLFIFCRKGEFGAWWRIAGFISYPMALLLVTWVGWLNPFGTSVCTYFFKTGSLVERSPEMNSRMVENEPYLTK
jgi:hypothetical protein